MGREAQKLPSSKIAIFAAVRGAQNEHLRAFCLLKDASKNAHKSQNTPRPPPAAVDLDVSTAIELQAMAKMQNEI